MSEEKGEARPALTRRAKRLFIFINLVAWTALTLLAVEVYTIFSWQRIEANNPYVRARRGEIPWPGSSSTPPEEVPVVASTPEEDWLPQPAPLEAWARRAAYFVSLPSGDRATFARVYEQNVYVLDAGGVVTDAYLYPPINEMPEDVATHSGETIGDFAAALAAGDVPLPARRVFEEGGHTVHAVRVQTPPGGMVLFIDGVYPRPAGLPEDSIYEIPWFSYRKHATLPRRHFSPVDLGSEQFSTNNYGFRDRDVQVPKPGGTFRIVCVGASTTEEGMNNAYTYPNLLEAALNTHFITPQFDVINAGIAGHNITKERMRLADYLALEPDIILAYNAVNDISHFHFMSWINKANAWQRLLRKSRAVTYYFNRLFTPSDEAIREALIEQTITQLVTMHERAAEHGVTVVLSTFARPDIDNLTREERAYFDLYAYDLYRVGSKEGRLLTFATYCRTVDIYNQALRDVCQERGIPLVDIAAGVTGGAKIFGDVCHMRNRGIEAKANVVFEHFTGPLAALLPANAREAPAQ